MGKSGTPKCQPGAIHTLVVWQRACPPQARAGTVQRQGLGCFFSTRRNSVLRALLSSSAACTSVSARKRVQLFKGDALAQERRGQRHAGQLVQRRHRVLRSVHALVPPWLLEVRHIGGEQAGPMEVQKRIKVLQAEGVKALGGALRDGHGREHCCAGGTEPASKLFMVYQRSARRKKPSRSSAA